MIQNLTFAILLLKILFPAYKFFIFIRVFQQTSSKVSFDFRFSGRKSQSQQKLSIKMTHFAIQFRSKQLTHFTSQSSLDIENNMLLKHSQKPFALYKFSSKHILVSVRKNFTISWYRRTAFLKHFERKCLCISVNFCIYS